MLMVLSPAKTLDYESPLTTESHTMPDFIPRSAELISVLRDKSPAEIGSLMQISDPLAQLEIGTRPTDGLDERILVGRHGLRGKLTADPVGLLGHDHA